MANWVLFTSTVAKPVPLAINLDLVKTIQAGTATGTVSLDGALVHGDFAQVMLMVSHATYPGAQGGAITTG